jgi:hypothetical protein
MQVQGTDPQTGDAVNEFKCVDAWNLLVNMETARQIEAVSCEVNRLSNTINSLGGDIKVLGQANAVLDHTFTQLVKEQLEDPKKD